VLFTATPFRRDRRTLTGQLIFTYHLRDAFHSRSPWRRRWSIKPTARRASTTAS
jgi:hypothetical protein